MRKYRSVEDDDKIGTLSSIAVTPAPQFLQHMIDFEDEQSEEETSFTEETIDEEFNSYVSSAPKRGATLDILKFWEVSTLIATAIISLTSKQNCKTNRETFPTIFKIALEIGRAHV